MRIERDKKIGRNSMWDGGVGIEEIDFLIFTKCTVTFHFWRATVHFVKKFEVEKGFYRTARAQFFVLLFTNKDT